MDPPTGTVRYYRYGYGPPKITQKAARPRTVPRYCAASCERAFDCGKGAGSWPELAVCWSSHRARAALSAVRKSMIVASRSRIDFIASSREFCSAFCAVCRAVRAEHTVSTYSPDGRLWSLHTEVALSISSAEVWDANGLSGRSRRSTDSSMRGADCAWLRQQSGTRSQITRIPSPMKDRTSALEPEPVTPPVVVPGRA